MKCVVCMCVVCCVNELVGSARKTDIWGLMCVIVNLVKLIICFISCFPKIAKKRVTAASAL